MVNRAGSSNSPYIRAHADTDIKWQLLDDEAIERAKKENKLIFLNVGFRACHCEYLCCPHPTPVLILTAIIRQTAT